MKKFYAVLIVFAALFLSFDISFAREEINPGPPLIITSGTYSDANESVNGGIFYNEGKLIINNLNGDIKFINNEVDTASCSGGAIYTVSGSTTTIGKGVEFSSNTAGWGGAIYNAGVMTIGEEALFSGNKTSNYGGVIYNNSQSTMTIGSGAKFSFNKSDLSGGAIYNNGTVTIGDGALFDFNCSGSGSYGGAILNDSSGELTFGAGAKFISNIAGSDSGAIENYGVLTISTGVSFISNTSGGDGGVMYNDGTVTIEDGALFLSNTAAYGGGAIYNSGGILNFTAETKNVEFTGNTANGVSNAIFDDGGTINLYTKGSNIIFNDRIVSWDNSSTLNINIDTAAVVSGKVILNEDMSGYTGDVNIYAGTVELGEKGKWFNGYVCYIDNAEINLINNSVDLHNFNNLTVDNEMILSVDADLEKEQMDVIKANNYAWTGKIKVKAVNILKDGNKNVTNISFTNLGDKVESVSKEGFSPIYKYNIKYNDIIGEMSFTRSGVNPMSQESGIMNFGIYSAQNEIVKQVFTNMAGGALEKRASLRNNLYVSADTERVFSGSSLKRGVWVSPYIVKDTIEFGKYVKDVENSINGILAGVDLVVDKDNGISLYCGYNGGSQKYDNVEMSQSGYILGASGIILKGKFYAGAAANVIINNNEAKSSLGTSETDNMGYSLGLKGGYDIAFGTNWTLEPNMILMYSGVTGSEYTNAGGYKVEDEGLSGLLIKPGVKAKVELTNGWQPYGLMDISINTGESATKVEGSKAEALKLDPYFECGLGVNKDFANTPWSAYAQLTGKAGSRAGSAINLGVKYAF